MSVPGRETSSWTEAIAQAKRAFVNDDYGERVTDPRFWTPFVYYGREAADTVD